MKFCTGGQFLAYSGRSSKLRIDGINIRIGSIYVIRPETTKDIEAIFSLTTEAFKSMPISDGSEPQIINDLRSDGDLVLSLVAIDQTITVGHVAFSPVTINDVDDKWFGLRPISVLPQLQRLALEPS